MLAKVRRLHPDATFDKAHDSDVGFDLTCCGWEIHKSVVRLELGVAVEPSRDYYFMLVPRSSFCKTGWTQANNVGIIDPDYRGEWMMNVSILLPLKSVLLEGHPGRKTSLNSLVGKKVAQAIPQYKIYGGVKFVEQLSDTERGEGGFGSTDNKPQGINPCLETTLKGRGYDKEEERGNPGHRAGVRHD